MGRTCFLVSSSFWQPLHSLAHGPFLHFQSALLLQPLLPLSQLPAFDLAPSYEKPCDYTEPIQIIQDNLPISRLLITSVKSHSLCKVT